MLLSTKLHIPIQRGQLVKRSTLMPLLQKTQGGTFILITAPAGYGKTTLVTQWLRSTQCPATWLSLDKTDNDPVQFWRYVIASLQTYETTVGVNTLNLLANYTDHGIENCIITLINDINEVDKLKQDTPLILVLDDFHTISSTEIIHSFDFFLNHLPPNLSVLITSRQLPNFSLAKFRSKNLLLEITAKDLKFDNTESQKFMQDVMHLKLKQTEIVSLQQRTEGWIAGLQLACLSLQHTDDSEEFIEKFSAHHHHISEYLMDEVFKQQTTEVKEFLKQTALLSKFTAPLCNAILNITNSNEILDFLEQANLFIVPLNEDRSWFRYHELFRELLEKKLTESNPEKISELRKNSGLWFESKGFLSDAINQALALKDWSWVANLIESIGNEKIHEGEFYTLHYWVSQIPKDVLLTNPKLLIKKTYGLTITSDAENATELLTQAKRLLNKELNDEEKQQYNIASDEEHYKLLNDINFLDFYFSRFIKKDEFRSESLGELQKEKSTATASSHFALGINYYVNGDMHKADEALSQAIDMAKKEGAAFIIFNSFSLLSRVHYLQGKFKEIFQIRENLRTWCATEKIASLPMSDWLHGALAEIYAELNQFEYAHDSLKPLLDHLDQANIGWMKVPILLHQFTILTRQKDYQSAEPILDQIDQIYQKEKIDWSFFGCASISALRAHLALLENNLSIAGTWANQNSSDLMNDYTFSKEEDRLILAKIWIALELYDEAVQLLTDIRRQAEKNNRLTHEIQTYILEVLAKLGQDNKHKAIELLKLALDKASSVGYIQMFIEAGPNLGQLIYQLSSYNIHPSYTRLLLANYGIGSSHTESTASNELVKQLSRRELDVLKLLDKGLKNKEIATELHISPETVKSHTIRIYKKMSVSNRTQALSKARSLGLLTSV